MRERAIFSILKDAEIPDDCRKEYNGGLYKEITLFLHPRAVQVEHDGICTLVGIGNIRHEGRMDRIAPVAPFRIIEIDHIK